MAVKNTDSIEFEEINNNSDLIVDRIYKSGNQAGLDREVIPKLFEKIRNLGGFRPVSRVDSKLPAYVVLVTSMQEPEWPDHLDYETGIFTYYGDNRQPGAPLNSKLGNKLLEKVFAALHSSDMKNIPPFFIFRRTGNKRDVQFLGLAAPGSDNISDDQELIAFWRTIDGERFQNYLAYFTILDTGSGKSISREWLKKLRHDHCNNLSCAPQVWIEFIKNGKRKALTTKVHKEDIPSKESQIKCDSNEGQKCIENILNYFKEKGNYEQFEACAVNIVEMMDKNFTGFKLTRAVRDGGRDAIGLYKISSGSNQNQPLKIECALEAKCYSPEKSCVGVKETSRLISRIRNRQFGVLVTTSYVNKQAYQEIIDDNHPILIITARDIARILLEHSITSSKVVEWIEDSIEKYSRLEVNV